MTIRNPYGTGTATATNNRINEITLQYRVGTSGNFTTLTGVDYQNNTETQTSGTTPQNLQARRITLPSACNNQPVIEIRWISRQVSGGGSRPSLAIDNVTIDENTDPPTITSLSPANEATNVSTNGTAIMVFNVSVQRGEGNILIKKRSDNTVVSTINVYSNAITVSGQNVFIDLTGLPATTELYIEVETGAFKDLFNTDFTGISGNSTWTFTTGTLLYNLNFQNCTSALSDGFTQYSETGSVVWGCTTFGRNSVDPSGSSASGVQINGFINSANQPNVDWLISPSLDLTGTNYPLLSFWSRTAFTGQMLQLKVSTDYVSGDPRLATWTDLNGKFPSQASNIWTLSENINLSDYKEANVHIAFIYTSTADDGARWTIDDIAITNSATPPPPTITTSASDVVFNYVAVGSHADKTFTFTGNDLTEGVTLTAGGVFQLSKDGESFSSTIEYTQEEANNNLTTVYVRFAPGQADQNFSGLIDISTSGVSASINLRGTSIDPATTLEVVNWNVEWFGHTGNGPTDEERQEQNVKTILTNVNADIYALSEVVDESRLANVVSQMPGFAYVISNFSSHTNTSRNPESALATAQKLAFVYKTDVFSNISTTALLSQGINSAADITNPAYYYWSSGRFPYMLSADVTLNGVTKPMKFVLVHAKANTNPTDESYNRRKKGADTLHYTLNQLYPNDQIIILGDFNDDLDYSITSGFTTTSWDNFTTDDDNFYEPTLPLSLAGKKSTVSYNDMIDHVVISNETKPYYMSSTASVLSDVTSMVSNYGSTTSDHYPVFTRYMFCKLTPPADITVSNDAGQCGAIVNFNVGSTMTCGTVTTVPASGSFFPLGETTVTVSATTGETATFKVTVNDAQNPSITAPNAVSVNADAGQCSASNANVNLGSPVYGDNCSNATVTNNAPTVFPVGNTIVTWTVTDASGNTATATQSVTVTDNQVPIITTCPAVPVQCYNPAGTYSIPMIAANDNCETITHSYVISGATSRSGNTANASGTFIVGTSIITWAVTDAHNNTSTCQTTVVINSPVITSVPDVYAVTPGGAANTIYIGYGPSSVTLNGSVSGGTAPYSYKWTVGSSAGPALNNTVSYSVTPATNTSYYFNVKDVYGCSAPLVIKTVNVVDVRCGPKLDKVTICQTVKGKRTTSCVSEKDVAGLLANGATLGSCSGASITNNTAAQVIEKVVPNTLTITAMPNPSRSQFSLFISGSSKEAISMIVVDGVGRNVEVRNNIKAGEHVQIGSSYKAGIYIVEIIQGDSRKQIKLVKLPG
jgi:endonuclease/exonuclease/phosphatase family metal-dependent hydrolase